MCNAPPVDTTPFGRTKASWAIPGRNTMLHSRPDSIQIAAARAGAPTASSQR
jgi:hypothetical protein